MTGEEPMGKVVSLDEVRARKRGEAREGYVIEPVAGNELALVVECSSEDERPRFALISAPDAGAWSLLT